MPSNKEPFERLVEKAKAGTITLDESAELCDLILKRDPYLQEILRLRVDELARNPPKRT